MKKLYVISADYNGEICHKIGVTKKEVDERIRQFKTGNCSQFKIEFIFQKESCIFTIEKRLHAIFEYKKIENEWFILDKEDLEQIPHLCEKYYKIYKNLNETNSYMKSLNRKLK